MTVLLSLDEIMSHCKYILVWGKFSFEHNLSKNFYCDEHKNVNTDGLSVLNIFLLHVVKNNVDMKYANAALNLSNISM